VSTKPDPAEVERACDIARAMAYRRYRGHHAVDDIAQEAALAVVLSLETHDPAKSSICTSGVRAAQGRSGRAWARESAHDTGRSLHEVCGNIEKRKPGRPIVRLDKPTEMGEATHNVVEDQQALDAEEHLTGTEDALRARDCYVWELRRIAHQTRHDVTRRTAKALIARAERGEELNGSEIGRDVGCTRQNVNLVHKRAVERARKRLLKEVE